MKNIIFIIDENKSYTESVEHEICQDSHYQMISFRSIQECYLYIHQKPDVVIMDDIKDPYRKSQIRSRIRSKAPDAKIIFIADPVSAAIYNEPVMTDKVNYVVNDKSMVQKVKIAVDEICFNRNYQENFDDDALIIDQKYGGKLKCLLPLIGFAMAVFIYIVLLLA